LNIQVDRVERFDLKIQVTGYDRPVSTGTRRGAAGTAAVPWLSEDEQRDWRSLVALTMALPAAIDAQLKRDAGVNMFEYYVLASLSAAPGRTLVLSDLAVLAQGSLSRLSHAITRLERAGWVERRSCSDRGRRVEAWLTDSGMAKLEKIAPGHVREARRLVIDALTPDQLAALGDAARAVNDVALGARESGC
jgi:DNA-binding MarR family transcriptional regulator